MCAVLHRKNVTGSEMEDAFIERKVLGKIIVVQFLNGTHYVRSI